MSPALEQRVLAYIRKHEMLRAGDRVGVAVSGGADSVALLRLLLELRGELGVVLSVVHFNHMIRGDAAAGDEQFVRELAVTHGLELHASSADTPAYSKEKKMSLEAAARELRYGYFDLLMRSAVLNKVATAHTLDDQAETVLLRIIRGTGITGLAGIHPRVAFADVRQAAVVRPLLHVRRPDLEAYLSGLGQGWREDATNLDTTYTRNRVRHNLLPLIEREFNAGVRDRLAELAEIARAEEWFWEEKVGSAAGEITHASDHATTLGAAPSSQTGKARSEHRLQADQLLQLPVALQRRILLRLANELGMTLEFRHVEQVRSLMEAGANARIDLPGGAAEYRILWTMGSAPRRTGAELRLRASQDPILRGANVGAPAPHRSEAGDYSYMIFVPGEVQIPELSAVLSVRLIDVGRRSEGLKAENMAGEPASAGYNASQLLDPGMLSAELTVRNWRPGDRFWPAHTAAPKKVKELLQQKHIVGRQRQLWPVMVSGEEIVWMQGFPAAESHRTRVESGKAALIELKPLSLDTGFDRK